MNLLRLPRKWEGEAPAEPWNSAKMGFDRSLTLPHKTRNALASAFSSEAVFFLDGGFMGSPDPILSALCDYELLFSYGGAVLPHSTDIKVARQRRPTGLVSRFIESSDSLRRFVGRVCLLLCLLCHCGSSFAFTAIYAFGDSLTDTGNRPANATLYYENRFSNGPLWIEYFSEYLGIRYEQSHNMAVSTSTTGKTLAQAQGFLAPKNSADAVYIVWAAGNDFLNGLVNGLDLVAWENTISTAVNNLSNSVEILYAKGARTIIVPNAVDYSHVPGSAFFPLEFQETIRAQVVSFNTSLRSSSTPSPSSTGISRSGCSM